MHFFSTCAAALSLAASSVLGSPVDLQPRQRTTQCASGVHVIVGCPRTYPAQAGALQSLINGIQSNITGSDYYLVPYNQSATPGKDASPVMMQAVKDYSANCPNTPIALIGYSLGGIVVMNTVCGGIPSTLINNNVLAAVTYGEETYRGGQTYDTGTCTADSPQSARADPSTCAAYAPILRNYCNAADSACCATGTDINAHYTYATQYDQISIAWIWQKYSAWKVAKTPKPSSTKPSSSVAPTPKPSSSSSVKPSSSSSVRTSSPSSVKPSTSSTAKPSSSIAKPTSSPSPSPVPKPQPQPQPQPVKRPWQQWLDWWHQMQEWWNRHH